ncbi:MAG: FABP family protein, partial [Acidimicrobiales bacterium]|nr:FABP family protein [Acidimicrobiales bacterium]
PEPGRIELVVAHPSGHVEVAAGELAGTTLRLRSTVVVGTDTAKSVTSLERTLEVDGDLLHCRLSMAAVDQPLQGHLTAELRRA